MFLGHYAVGFAAKKVALKTSLGTLVAAAVFLDLLWPVFVLTGIERLGVAPGITAVTPLDFEYYPFSHSLLAAAGWAVLFGACWFALTRDGRASLWAGLLVVSHWFLDLVVHRPDLPLWPGGGPRAGLGLWNSVAASVALEYGLLAAGVWVYARATRPRDAIGRWGFRAYVALLAGVYAANVFGPPPPGAAAVAAVALSAWLLVLWAWWFDRHRETSGPVP